MMFRRARKRGVHEGYTVLVQDPVHAPRNTAWKTVFDVVLIVVLLCHIGYTIMLLLGRSAQPPSARHYPTTLRQQEIDNKSFVHTTLSVSGVQASNSLPPASTLQQVRVKNVDFHRL